MNFQSIFTKILSLTLFAGVLLYSPAVFAQTASSTVTGTTSTTSPEYNQSLDVILNENISPKASTTPAKTISTTTTPAPVSTTTAGTIAPTDSNNSKSTPATKAALDSQLIKVTNSLLESPASTNYYVPLDNLSPEMTYILSAIAMLLGIWGAFLIIREPQEAVVWTPGIQARARNPLLKP